MSYYGQGDYYRGDYYRGDPGLLSGLLKVGKSLITGGPIAAGITAATQIARRPAANPVQGTALAPLPMRLPVLSAVPPLVGPVTSQVQTGGLIQVQSLQQTLASGINPRTGRPLTEAQKRKIERQLTGLGHRKRMNVANPRALRRALRRVAGFGKLAKRAKRDIARAASAVGVRRGGGRGSPGVITRSEAARALRR